MARFVDVSEGWKENIVSYSFPRCAFNLFDLFFFFFKGKRFVGGELRRVIFFFFKFLLGVGTVFCTMNKCYIGINYILFGENCKGVWKNVCIFIFEDNNFSKVNLAKQLKF